MEQEQDDLENIKSNQNSNRIMGMAAIFISILSMITLIYQSYLAREENELIRIQQGASVLPYLDFSYSNVGNKYEFYIENKGVGPAFIKDVKFIVFDLVSKDTVFHNSSHSIYEFVKEKSIFLDSISVTKSSFKSNMLISPNERINYLVFQFDNNTQRMKFKDEFYKYFSTFEIIYEDVYGSRWTLKSQKDYPMKLNEKLKKPNH